MTREKHAKSIDCHVNGLLSRTMQPPHFQVHFGFGRGRGVPVFFTGHLVVAVAVVAGYFSGSVRLVVVITMLLVLLMTV